jgi:hypothetical protein
MVSLIWVFPGPALLLIDLVVDLVVDQMICAAID